MKLPTLLLSSALLLAAPAAALARTADPTTLAQQRTTVIYDVQDLTRAVGRDELAPFLRDPTGTERDPLLRQERYVAAAGDGDTPTPADLAARAREAAATCAALVRAIEQLAQPRIDGADRIQVVADTALVATLRPEQHAWMRGFLERQRTFDGLLQFESKLVIGPLRDLLGIEEGVNVRIFEDREERARFLETVTGASEPGGRLGVLQSPRLVLFPGRQGRLEQLNQTAYVADWDVRTVEPGGKTVLDPVIETVDEGARYELRGFPLPDGGIFLEFSLSHSVLQRPIPTFETEIGLDRTVEVALPEVHTREATGHVALSEGAGAVFLLQSEEGGGEPIGFVLHATSVPRVEDAHSEDPPDGGATGADRQRAR